MSAEEDNRKIENSIRKEMTEKGLKEGLEKGLKEGREKGLKEGLKQGIEQSQKEIVLSMIEQGLDIETIEKYTNINHDFILTCIEEK